MITTNGKDLILVGHGTYLGGADTFVLPQGVELHLTQPVGSALIIGAAAVLLTNTVVDRAVLVRQPPRFDKKGAQVAPAGKGWDDFATLQIGNGTVYHPGDRAPNLVLHDLGEDKATLQDIAQHGHSHVVYVGADSHLSDILANDPTVKSLIKAAVDSKQVLRVVWAACTAFDGRDPNPSPVVAFNAVAVAYAAHAYAAEHPEDKGALPAAQAAMAAAFASPLNTASAVTAAATKDKTAANLLKPL